MADITEEARHPILVAKIASVQPNMIDVNSGAFVRMYYTLNWMHTMQ